MSTASSSSSSSKKTVILQSSDGETFEVEASVAAGSKTIRHMIDMMEDDCAGTTIPVPNVTGKILSRVIEYLKRHHTGGGEAGEEEEEEAAMEAFDAEFVKVDRGTLYHLIMAANYLNISDLLDLTCQTVAAMIRSKTVEELKEYFNIKEDFTPDDEEEEDS